MKTILVVDDEFGIADTLAAVLGDEGYRVMLAVNGRQALDLLRASPELPDLILLDYMMPIMNGAETYAALCADPALARIPVVLMSAVASAAARAGFHQGAADRAFLEKPFELDQLLGVVVRLIGPPTG
jgi:CheY-like chemotaxis protein